MRDWIQEWWQYLEINLREKDFLMAVFCFFHIGKSFVFPFQLVYYFFTSDRLMKN